MPTTPTRPDQPTQPTRPRKDLATAHWILTGLLALLALPTLLALWTALDAFRTIIRDNPAASGLTGPAPHRDSRVRSVR